MAGSASARVSLQLQSPKTFAALQDLVMAMADVASSAGKKTIFGRDKGEKALERLSERMDTTIRAMADDGVFEASDSSEHVRSGLMERIELFAQGYPNWKDAYGFAVYLLVHKKEEAVASIDQIRRSQAEADYAFDNPLPSRGP